MKYILFAILTFSVFAVAQNATNVKSGAYSLRHNGDLLEKTYNSQKDAISAATKISNDCHVRTNGGQCPVAIRQPELMVTTVATASSKASSSRSSASASSVAVRSSQASSSAERITLTWQAPTKYANSSSLAPEKICGYSLRLGTKPEFQLKATGLEMSHIVDAPKTGETFQIATVEGPDECKNYSSYVTFEQSPGG